MRPIDDSLLDDISWREDELAVLKTITAQSAEASPRGKTLRRAYLSMLYAHYEGFSKYAWEEYLIRAAAETVPLTKIVPPLIENFTRHDISKMRSCPRGSFASEVQHYVAQLARIGPHEYEVIKTSNLWPNVFEDMCSSLSLTAPYIAASRIELKSLVSRRNDIAHGKNVLVSDADLRKLESAVWAVILSLAEDISNSVRHRLYLMVE